LALEQVLVGGGVAEALDDLEAGEVLQQRASLEIFINWADMGDKICLPGRWLYKPDTLGRPILLSDSAGRNYNSGGWTPKKRQTKRVQQEPF
jgi:hypothetical protein